MHPLLRPEVTALIDSAVSAHLGYEWAGRDFTDLNDRASHPSAIRSANGFDVFVKYSADPDGSEQFDLECRGLRLLDERGGARTPRPIGPGVFTVDGGAVLLLEGLKERAPQDRTRSDWRAIGRALAILHATTAETFGLDEFDGYFGPLRQDNRPVNTNQWTDFFRERRLGPFLEEAIRSGHLPAELVARVHRLTDRLGHFVGPEPAPTLLHGDAQQNNYLSTDAGAVLVDASPFFGHPENDLAMIDVFQTVPADVLDAYREVRPLDADFEDRRELWRVPVYLAIIAVDGGKPFGRSFIARLDEALRTYE